MSKVNVVTVSVPRQYADLANFLVNKSINKAKTLKNFIPYALKLEDKTVFQAWIHNQAEFLA